MALLRLIVVMLVLVAGCYAPDISDCSVTCTTNAECAGDQVCTPQGLCAGAATACDENAGTVDGGVSPPRMIALHVTVTGEGRVAIDGGGECDPDNSGPMGGTCTIQVPAGPMTITAIEDDKPFERWTSIICAGQGATCNVTLQLDASVGAKFH